MLSTQEMAHRLGIMTKKIMVYGGKNPDKNIKKGMMLLLHLGEIKTILIQDHKILIRVEQGSHIHRYS